MECQYCKKIFSDKSNLKKHQTKARYCLKIQGVEIEAKYICKYCGKKFNRKDNLCTHIVSHEQNEEFMDYYKVLEKIKDKVCNLETTIVIKDASLEMKDNRISELEEEVKQYKRTLDSVLLKAIGKPTTINNKNYNLILEKKQPLRMEHQTLLQTYITDDVIISPNTRESYGGALTKFLKDIIVCSDSSRQKFISKISDDITDEDIGGIVTTMEGQRIIKDVGLSKVLAFLITPKLSAEHKRRVLALSMVEFAKTNDLDTLAVYSEKIELFQKASEGELIPLFKSIVSDMSNTFS